MIITSKIFWFIWEKLYPGFPKVKLDTFKVCNSGRPILTCLSKNLLLSGSTLRRECRFSGLIFCWTPERAFWKVQVNVLLGKSNKSQYKIWLQQNVEVITENRMKTKQLLICKSISVKKIKDCLLRAAHSLFSELFNCKDNFHFKLTVRS